MGENLEFKFFGKLKSWNRQKILNSEFRKAKILKSAKILNS